MRLPPTLRPLTIPSRRYPVGMMRAARLLLGLAWLLAGAVTGARADEVVVVLDRGEGAKEKAAEHERVALALLEAYAKDAPRLVLYGARPDGRARSGVLSRGFAKALDQSRTREGWRYDGPTDIRKALDLARGRAREGEALLVFLIGPFAGPLLEADEGGAFLDAWKADAAARHRVIPLFASNEARALLEGVEGVQQRGWVVLGHGEAEVQTSPFAPLADDARLEARVRLPLDLVAVGRADGVLPIDVVSDREGDRLDVDARRDGLHVHLRRDDLARDEATLTFRLPDDADVLALVSAPAAVEFRWGERIRGARLEQPEPQEEALRYEALEVIGKAAPHTVAILVADADTASTWSVSDERGALPTGLEIDVSTEDTERPHVRRHVFEMAFAYPGQPVDVSGSLLIRGTGHDATFHVPYRLSTAPARIHVRPDGDDADRKLPLAEEDSDLVWLVEHLAGNVPPHIRLRVLVGGDALAEHLDLDVRVGERDDPLAEGGGQTITIAGADLPTRVRVRPRLQEDAWPEDGEIRLTLVEEAGVLGTADGAGRLTARRPRLVLEPGPAAQTPPPYVLDDAVLEARRPWMARIDTDGGPASWRRALWARAPVLAWPADAPIAWRLDALGDGAWALVPEGPWSGERAGTFEAREESLAVQLDWPLGPAPGAIGLPVLVKPRWGSAGWILVGLAAIALVIGGIALSHLRSPAVVGTLLYAVEGKEGAVGRLDLSAVGRGRRALRVDEAGRLHLGGKGSRLGQVRASRIGGMLDVDVPDGERTRHLLVDGLALETGSHRLRYVSGRPEDSRVDFQPEPVPDLLGPEFDLTGGRIRSLDLPGPESEDPSPPEGDT